MDTSKGLSIPGKINFEEVLNITQRAPWLDFSRQIAQLSGSKELLNLTSGLGRLDKFLFRMLGWPIGGIYFDGIMSTNHSSSISATQYPVQNGLTFTDHATIKPASLTITIMMSDCSNAALTTNGNFMDTVYNALKILRPYLENSTGKTFATKGEGRSAATWSILKHLQMSRVPIVVETRLGTYNNMLIEEISTSDDLKTLHALRCTIKLTEILVAQVAETKVAARSIVAKQTNGGQNSAKVDK